MASSHQCDVVGWDGCLHAYTFNVDDFEPTTGRVHQPPAVLQVFEGAKEYLDELAVMVDTFRPLELGEAGLAADDGAYALSWDRVLKIRAGTDDVG